MALFDTKQKKTPKEKKPKAAKRGATTGALADAALEGVLSHPWLSEKALIGTERGVYVFAVPGSVTKQEVARAVERLYKVVPMKVNIANLPAKLKPMRGKRGRAARAERHKAYVYLKKGETITF
jgi:large subunit ribosomal protein L23